MKIYIAEPEKPNRFGGHNLREPERQKGAIEPRVSDENHCKIFRC